MFPDEALAALVEAGHRLNSFTLGLLGRIASTHQSIAASLLGWYTF